MKNMVLKRVAALLMAAAMLTGTAVGSAQVSEVEAGTISEKRARNIAVDDARVRNSDVMAMDIYEDTAKGQDVYAVSFYEHLGNRDDSRDFVHYKYNINSHNGNIVSKNHRKIKVISADQAINKALDRAGTTRGRVTNKYLDYGEDDGNLVYNISFAVPIKYYDWDYDIYGDYYVRYYSDGYCDYNFVINAVNGKILDWDSDEDYYY